MGVSVTSPSRSKLSRNSVSPISVSLISERVIARLLCVSSSSALAALVLRSSLGGCRARAAPTGLVLESRQKLNRGNGPELAISQHSNCPAWPVATCPRCWGEERVITHTGPGSARSKDKHRFLNSKLILLPLHQACVTSENIIKAHFCLDMKT